MRLTEIATGITLALIPSTANAIATTWTDACESSQLACHSDLNVPISGLALTATGAFGAFMFAMFIYYGVKLLVSTADENAQTETRKAIVFAIFGTVLVVGSQVIASSFTSWGVIRAGTAIETSVLAPVKTFIVGLVGIALIVTITFQGIRLIIAQDESQSSAARKRFIEGLIGAVVVTLVDTVVDAFIPGTGMGQVSTEMAGISRFLATIFGFLAVVAMIIGGIMLVASVNDDLKDKGKKLIIAGIISLVVVWISYALVRAFIT